MTDHHQHDDRAQRRQLADRILRTANAPRLSSATYRHLLVRELSRHHTRLES